MRLTILILATLGLACASQPKSETPAEQAPATTAKTAATTKVAGTKTAPTKAAPTAAAASATADLTKSECSSGNDKRMLEIRAKDKGCELAYTKSGQENVVATSGNGRAHCENISKQIQSKLESSGFTCN